MLIPATAAAFSTLDGYNNWDIDKLAAQVATARIARVWALLLSTRSGSAAASPARSTAVARSYSCSNANGLEQALLAATRRSNARRLARPRDARRRAAALARAGTADEE